MSVSATDGGPAETGLESGNEGEKEDWENEYAHEFGLADNTGEMDFDALFDLPEEVSGEKILDQYDNDREFWSVTYGTGLNWEEYTEFDANREGQEDHVAEADIPGIPVYIDEDGTNLQRDGSTQPSFTPPIGGREGVYNVHETETDAPTSGFNGIAQKLDNFEALKYHHRERSYDVAEADAAAIEAYPEEYQHIFDRLAEDEDASVNFVTASEEKYDPDLERNPGYVLKILPGVKRIDERLETADSRGDLTVDRDFADDFMATTHDEVIDGRVAEEYDSVDEYAHDLVEEVEDAGQVDTLRREFATALPLAEQWLN